MVQSRGPKAELFRWCITESQGIGYFGIIVGGSPEALARWSFVALFKRLAEFGFAARSFCVIKLPALHAAAVTCTFIARLASQHGSPGKTANDSPHGWAGNSEVVKSQEWAS
jgi:hypothetical protein